MKIKNIIIILSIISVFLISGCYSQEGFVDDTIGIYGSASGDLFNHYEIEVAEGRNPAEWTTKGISLRNDGLVPIESDLLALWDTTLAQDGKHTVKLNVFDNSGSINENLLYFTVNNLEISYPAQGSYINIDEYESSEDDNQGCYLPNCLDIIGTVKGTNLDYYAVEYSLAASLDWSSDGIKIVNDGKSEVFNELLAEWNINDPIYNNEYLLRVRAFNKDGSVREEVTRLFITGSNLIAFPVSEIRNERNFAIDGYLFVKIEKDSLGEWQDYDIVIDDKNPRTILRRSSLDIYKIWNELDYVINEPGSYKLYIAFRNQDGSIIQTESGLLAGGFEFEILDQEKPIDITECEDGTKPFECSPFRMYCNLNGELTINVNACSEPI